MSRKQKQKSYKFGIIAEYIVILYLTCKCYRVLARRYRTRAGEIDIIAKRGRTIAFIEVKARKHKDGLFEVLSHHQQQRIARATSIFMAKNRRYNGYAMRLDLIFITPGLFIRHIRNGWGE